MRRRMKILFAIVFVIGLCATGGSAQYPVENHYLIYESPANHVVDNNFDFVDQFYTLHTTFLEFDKFANPVRKNGEDYWDYGAHQTWYWFDQPLEDVWQVDLNNQFGSQRWYVKDARYLVVPAEKTMAGTPPPQYEHNHFTCYEVVQAPTMNFPVNLVDQFVQFESVAMQPLYFCNPCAKWVNGIMVSPIVDPDVHLAVYQLEPGWPFNGDVTAEDQFGAWQFVVDEAVWLAVPSWKFRAVGNEQSSWGAVKSMYR